MQVRLFIFLLIILGTHSMLSAQGNLKSPEDTLAYNQAIEFFNEAYGNESKLTNPERIKLLEKSDSVFRELKDWKYSIASLNELCNISQMERAYDKIDKYSKEALVIAEENLPEDDAYYGFALNLRGTNLWSFKGDYKNAIQLLKKAINVNKKNNVPPEATAYVYYNLADCYQDAGDYDEAINQLKNVLKTQLNSTGSAPDLTVNIYNQIGLCYTDKKRYDLAIQNFEAGINYAKSIPTKMRGVDQIILYLYQNLADLYLKTKRFEKAKNYTDLALEFQQGQAFIKDAYTLSLKGDILLQQGKYDKAIRAFSESIELAKKEYQNFDYHLQIGLAYHEKASAFLKMNQPDSVIHYCQLALRHNTGTVDNKSSSSYNGIDRLVSPIDAIDIFATRAQAYRQKSQQDETNTFLEKAFEDFELAVRAIAKTRQIFIAEGSKLTLAEKVNQIYESAINTTYELFIKTQNRDWLVKGIQFAENNKSSALFESIRERTAIGKGSIPDDLLRLDYDLKVDIAYYEKLIYETKQQKEKPAQKVIEKYESILFDKKELHQKLIDQFEADFPDYFELKYKTIPLDLSVVQENLDDQILIEYFVGNNHVFAFSITQDQINCKRIKRTSELEENINTLRRLIINPPNTNQIADELQLFKKISYRLYEELLQSILGNSKSKIDRVLIIPDDILAYLPFSVLLTTELNNEGQGYKILPYLFNDYYLSYHYSIHSFSELKDRKLREVAHDFAGFAPSFNASDSTTNLSPLSCNSLEVDQIGNLLESKERYTKESASLKKFKEKARESRILHLATHAVLENQNSAFNRIYFSDDYLSLNDLSSLNLQTDLIVLSACNSGSGNLQKGEGVMSLSKGFFRAGCPSVLTSLWAVDDCATAEVMLSFYEKLKQGASKEVALSYAKKQYLTQTSDLLQAHPYYWAAFVQYGDLKALKNQTDSTFYLVLVGLVSLAFLVFFLRRR